MSNPASSSRAERAPRRWHREPWPWLLAAGPLAVVVASLCSAWLAVRSDDGLVAEDYYKRGLMINQKLAHAPAAAALQPGATVRVAANGEVRARLHGIPNAVSGMPATIRLRLAHPGHPAPERVVPLARDAEGDYVGMLPEQTPGRWIVILESDEWRLPATTVAGRMTEIQLGAAPGRS
jgi:hypothetical protein